MSEIIVHEPLASQIRQEAEQAGVDAENLIAAAVRHYRFQAQRRKIEAEAEWWRSVPSEMRARYTGEFVAVHDQVVLDHDRDEEALRKHIRARHGKTPVLITPAEGRREFRMLDGQRGEMDVFERRPKWQ